MTLKSTAIPDGFETRCAQMLQAEAIGIPSSAHMNPMLDRLADTFASASDRNSIMGLLNLPAHAARVEERG
jgi:hypothetical protein